MSKRITIGSLLGGCQNRQGVLDEPPVYKAPTEGSERIGYQTNLVITKWPLDKVNGFVRILWGQKGIPAWIAENLIVPYHNPVKATAKCTPQQMANGNISFWIE